MGTLETKMEGVPPDTNTLLPEKINKVTISQLYLASSRSFELLLICLGSETCDSVKLGYIDPVQVAEAYGRLNIWGEQSRANLPASARGSLDDTLRQDHEVKSLVQGILGRLDAVLRQAIALSEKSVDDEFNDSDLESASSLSSSGYSSASDVSGRESKRHNHKTPRIATLLQHAKEQIRSLFELSSVLRRPTVQDKWIRSEAKTVAAERQELDDAYVYFDTLHVMEKLTHWRDEGKALISLPVDDEKVSPALIPRPSWVCQRLAKANVRRRQQLKHWIDHPYGQTAKPHIHLTRESNFKISEKSTADTNTESKSEALTLRPPESQHTLKRASDQSTTTKQSFSTAALSDALRQTSEAGRARTVYAPTVGGGRRSNRVPDAPKSPEVPGSTLACPYCGMLLDAEIVQKRSLWKRHVFRDLRPYVCTFQDCQTPEKLFVSRTDWIYHEIQMHRRQFVCKECTLSYEDEQSLSEHLTTKHAQLFTSHQLPFVLRLCNRPADEASRDTCLLCGEEMSLIGLQSHLAAHLEELALFVLPEEPEDGQGTSSNISNRVAGQQKSLRKSLESRSDTESLEFSDSGGAGGAGTPHGGSSLGQTLQSLSQLQDVEASEFTTKVVTWDAAGGEGEENNTHNPTGEGDLPAKEPQPGAKGEADPGAASKVAERAPRRSPSLTSLPIAPRESEDETIAPESDGAVSQKAMLSKALQRANNAVQLDNAQIYEGARESYAEACDLLAQVLSRTSGDEDRRKLETIKQTYTSRIDELDQMELVRSPDGKELPARSESFGLRPEPVMHVEDDETEEIATIEPATLTKINEKDLLGDMADEVREGIWGYLRVEHDGLSSSELITLKRRFWSSEPGLGPKVLDGLGRAGYSREESLLMSSRGYTIGRDNECDLVVNHETVSNRHCVIFPSYRDGESVAYLVDTSTNGTYVNSRIVGRNKQQELQDEDEINLSSTNRRLIFRYPRSRHATAFLQDYELREKIGKGHFAEVYSCVEKSTGHRYAVKVFSRVMEEAIRQSLQQELAILMAVSHPNIQCTKATYSGKGADYVVLELAPEGELFNFIVMKQKLTEDETRRIFKQLFSAVEYLHVRNICHKDIKPENILLYDKIPTIKLCDFGLAETVGEDEFMTTLCGTPSYVAPEILAEAKHRKYGKGVDIWSLGVVLYICLCGFPPFSDELYSKDFPFTLSQQIKSGTFDYPSPYWDPVGDPALDLIDNMIVVDPERRFTIEQCLSHPWFTKNAPVPIPLERRKPASKRTLISEVNKPIDVGAAAMKEGPNILGQPLQQDPLDLSAESPVEEDYQTLIEKKKEKEKEKAGKVGGTGSI